MKQVMGKSDIFTLYTKYVLMAVITLYTGTALISCGGPVRDSQIDVRDCYSGSVTVRGEAPIFTSVSAARMKAREDACRTAVQICIGETIAGVSAVEDAQSVTNEIFSRAQGLCRNDQILEEDTYDLDTIKMLRLVMRYEISETALRNQIDTMQQLVGNPKVMVLILENYTIEGRSRVQGFTAGRSGPLLKDFLISKGYSIVDPPSSMLRGINENAVASNVNTLSEDLRNQAADAGADILVIGKISAEPQSISTIAGTDMKSYRATGNISILTLWGAGHTLGEYSTSESGAQVTNDAAARSSVERFTIGTARNPQMNPGGLATFVDSRLSREWSRIARNNVILMRIRGLDQSVAGTFRDDLMERTSVRRVNELRSDEEEIVWEVTYPGRVFSLRDTLAFYGDSPAMFIAVRESGKTIRITDVSRGEIHLVFE